MKSVFLSAASLMLLAGCAAKPVAIAIAPPAPPPVPVVATPLPQGAYPGMVIPAALPDGTYPTPNRNLTADATLWHLRAALNVAALACRGADGDAIVAGYNAMLGRDKSVLAAAQTRYAAQYGTSPAARDAYDDAMTRLYNFFSQSPARADFCAAAKATLADAETVPAAEMTGFAAQRLPMLERPFTDFYRAYDAWRGTAVAAAPAPLPERTVIAIAAAPQTAAAPPPGPRAHPRLELDPSVFQN